MKTTAKKPDVQIAVIGAGFSGLGMAIKLKEAGISDFLVVEAAADVGGTWRDAKYPGAAVDVPSHLYSYSFEQSSSWTRNFAKSEEIQRYILDMTDHHALRPKIRFQTRITGADFDEKQGWWRITTSQGDSLTAKYVVSAIGPFAESQVPQIPGLKKFRGEMVHTANWKQGLDLRRKKVAVVGSGASAIQVAPAIAPIVGELKIFQRTPSWIVPKLDYEYSDLEKAIYRTLPIAQKMRRQIIFALTEFLATGIVWDTFMTTLLEKLCLSHIRSVIKDEGLLKKVIPQYRLGRTRMLISNDWYPTLIRPNTELVNHGVDEVTETGVVAGGIHYEADVIVWATGYKSPSQGFPFPITGRNDRDLNTYWKDGAKGYRGLCVAGFPNLFSLMGPNTGPGHTSVLVYVEAQQDYILKAIRLSEEKNLKFLEVTEQAQERFNRELDEKMRRTTWGQGGNSWYYTKDGRNTTLYPGFASEYVLSIRQVEERDFLLQKREVKEPSPEKIPLAV